VIVEVPVKSVRDSLWSTFISGVLIVVPTYLALIVLLRGMRAVADLVRPLAALLPNWLPNENLIALLLVFLLCVAVGSIVRTRIGHAAANRLEAGVFGRIPGYGLFRGLTQQLVGEGREAWKPALVEIEEALVPAFIIEEIEDDRYTVYVPSVPSPLAGAVYILTRERVHPLSATFLQTFQTLSRWGSGSRQLLATMQPADAVHK
jgi:uncharacterized membrane protein